MNVVSLSTLKAFWDVHPQAKGPLLAWYVIARRADWPDPQAIRAAFNSADFVGDNRVIFNIAGNKYRLIVRVSYVYKAMLVKFVGTHADYDRIDPNSV